MERQIRKISRVNKVKWMKTNKDEIEVKSLGHVRAHF